LSGEHDSSDESSEFSVCPFPYGTAEHLAWELRDRFDAQIAGFSLWAIDMDDEDRNIAFFLNEVYERYGIEEAQFCAQYLMNFETLPQLTDKTREHLTFNRLEREMGDIEDLF
jgi:hypothetical protein